jgi:hypothetical protein
MDAFGTEFDQTLAGFGTLIFMRDTRKGLCDEMNEVMECDVMVMIRLVGGSSVCME